MTEIIGIDEVGRGSLIGDVVTAAVIIPKNVSIIGLTDSKKISPYMREVIFTEIISKCIYSIGRASCKEVDELNVLNATMLAMKRAFLTINRHDLDVVVDGNRCPNIPNCTAIIKGDTKIPEISAASIVAKVTRDREMIEFSKLFPKYGFDKHKGYGTKLHKAAIMEFGVLDQHRKSFAPIKHM